MRNPWLALGAGADAAERAGQLRRAHERFLSGGPVAAPVRDVVADFWRRCAGARLGPESMAGVEVDDAGLAQRRETHPLARATPLFRELPGTIAEEGAHTLRL